MFLENFLRSLMTCISMLVVSLRRSESLNSSVRWGESVHSWRSLGERRGGINNPDALAQLPTGTAQISQLEDFRRSFRSDTHISGQVPLHNLGNQQTIEIDMPLATKILPRWAFLHCAGTGRTCPKAVYIMGSHVNVSDLPHAVCISTSPQILHFTSDCQTKRLTVWL